MFRAPNDGRVVQTCPDCGRKVGVQRHHNDYLVDLDTDRDI